MSGINKLSAALGNYDQATAFATTELVDLLKQQQEDFRRHAQFQDETILALLNEVKAMREELNHR